MSILAERPSDQGEGLVLDLKPLEKFNRAFAQVTGLSVAFLSAEGRPLTAFSHPQDQVHPRLLACREILKELLSSSGEAELVSGPGGSLYGAARIHPNTREVPEVLSVLVGPAWSTPPTAEEREALIRALGGGVVVGEGHRVLRGEPEGLPMVARTVAELAAEVIEEGIRRRRELSTFAALYEVGSAISSSLELNEVLQTVLDRAIQLLDAEKGSLMLLDETDSELRILVAHGLDEQIVATTRVRLGEGISGWVAREGKPRLMKGGVRQADSLKAEPPENLPSAMCVPLAVKSRCLGVLNISGRRQDGDFTEEDLQVLTILAGHAASAIEHAQLYERVRRQLGELEGLHRVGSAINSSLDLEDTLQEVLEQAMDLMAAETASVMLRDEEREELYIRVARGLPEEVVRNTRVPLGERVSGRVAREGRPRLLPRGRRPDGSEIASALCVPLKAEDRVIGVLNIRGKTGGGDFTREDLQLACRLATISAAAIENAGLHEELHNLFMDAITALANAIDARDPYTRGHSERVTAYTVMMAQEMGYKGEELEYIRYASLLHDIGKIRIRDHILNKPGNLTEEEFAEMKLHPQYGVEIMKPVKAFHRVLPYMLYHHERYAGGGYPHGLKGEEIPLPARIMCVGDCFDAMTSDRPYRKGMPLQEAVKELTRNAGTQFDPQVVEVFLKLVEQGKVQPVVESQRVKKEPSEQLIDLVDRYGYQSARAASRKAVTGQAS